MSLMCGFVAVLSSCHKLASTKSNMAQLHETGNATEKARQLFLECQQIYAKVHGRSDSKTVDAARQPSRCVSQTTRENCLILYSEKKRNAFPYYPLVRKRMCEEGRLIKVVLSKQNTWAHQKLKTPSTGAFPHPPHLPPDPLRKAKILLGDFESGAKISPGS